MAPTLQELISVKLLLWAIRQSEEQLVVPLL
jgi:hypothetical protein